MCLLFFLLVVTLPETKIGNFSEFLLLVSGVYTNPKTSIAAKFWPGQKVIPKLVGETSFGGNIKFFKKQMGGH